MTPVDNWKRRSNKDRGCSTRLTRAHIDGSTLLYHVRENLAGIPWHISPIAAAIVARSVTASRHASAQVGGGALTG